MAGFDLATTTGERIALDESAAHRLKASLRGDLLGPGDHDYDATRSVWNGMIDHRPALIARCAGVGDVAAVVAFAREHDLLASVRGGGHNIAGKAVCEHGLMIDLSPMRGVQVEPDHQTARVEGGATLGELDRATQEFGLATTAGVVTHTGVGGLTLGGGVGRLARRHGLACDNLVSVDLVTAEGRAVRASATENADLFWAVRGGGGNFGIATSFEFRLHPVGPAVLGGIVVHPLIKASAALEFYYEYSHGAPDELSADAGFLTSPDGDPVFAVSVCYIGSLEQGERVLEPLRRFGPPLVDQIGPVPYAEVQSAADAVFPAGLRLLLAVPLSQGDRRRRHRGDRGTFRQGSIPSVGHHLPAVRRGRRPCRPIGNGLLASGRGIRCLCCFDLERLSGVGRAQAVGPGVAGDDAPFFHRRRVCQQSGRRRRRPGPCSIRRELRTSGRSQGQV